MTDFIKQSNALKNIYTDSIQSWKKYTGDYFNGLLNEEKEKLSEHCEFILKKIGDLPKEERVRNSKLATHKEEIFHYLKNSYSQSNIEHFNEIHNQWIYELERIESHLMVDFNKIQLEERFKIQVSDNLILKILKSIKIGAYKISVLPLRFINLFRKQKKEILYWSHYINIKGLFNYHFKQSFITKWVNLEEKINKEKCRLFLLLKTYEEDSCNNPVLSVIDVECEWDTFTVSLLDEIEKWYQDTLILFEKELELSGTIEYPNSRLRSNSLMERELVNKRKWEEEKNNWNNTLYALFEKWRSDLELDSLQFYTSNYNFIINNLFENWALQSVQDYLDKINSFLTSEKEKYLETDLATLKKTIIQSQYQVKKTLDPLLIKPFEERLSKNTLLNQIDQLQHKINTKIQTLTEEHIFTKFGEFNQGIKSNDLQKVSNYDLISFEVHSKFIQKIEKVKNELLISVNDLLIQTGDIDEVVAYALLTSGDNLKREDFNVQECLEISKDGFERGIQKTQEIISTINGISLKLNQEFDDILGYLVKEIQDLSEIENVASVRLRINKAKAKQQSKALFDRLKTFISMKYAEIRDWALSVFVYIASKQNLIKNWLIPSASSAIPSLEVSNFLNEATKIIDKLPLVYRKLYVIEPLNEPFLFEGREKEINSFQQAYNQWQENKSSSVLISGEKWSGLTSILNQLLLKIKFTIPVIRHAFNKNNPDPEELIRTFSKILNNQELKSSTDIINHLNGLEKRVIILEDIQKLYLRKINNFTTLLVLLEIIASTRQQVFWVTTITTYASQFLDKTIQLSAAFNFIINLSEFSPFQISNLVIKRNRISGFKLFFEPTKVDLKDRKFLKFKEEDKQEYLRNRFFKELNTFAKSNVSMALQYWLLSTKEIRENMIVISILRKLDLSFLSLLPMDKVFVLHSLILHDGLDIVKISQTLSYPLQKTKLLLLNMEKDGIVIQNDGVYMVNLLVYRNVIQLLRSKNLVN